MRGSGCFKGGVTAFYFILEGIAANKRDLSNSAADVDKQRNVETVTYRSQGKLSLNELFICAIRNSFYFIQNGYDTRSAQ